MPSPTSSVAADHLQPDTDLDPACDTGLLFDVCGMVDTIDRTDLCSECKKHLCRLIYDGFHNVLLNDEDLLTIRHPSKICYISRGNESGRLEFTTTTNPEALLIEEVVGVKTYIKPSDADRNTAAERLIGTLFNPEDDVWSLDQCRLWHVLDGSYSIGEAVRGRSFAEFARNHMILLNRIFQNRARLSAECFGRCYPHPQPMYNVAGVDSDTISAVALNSALRFTDPRVRVIVEDQLARPREWPEALRTERDPIRVLAVTEKTPPFEARMAALRHEEDYKSLEADCRQWIQNWRDNRQRRAELLEALPRTDLSAHALIMAWMREGDNKNELNKQMDLVEEAIECITSFY
ncbi:hypothetical protein MFIFM68171_03933 [Madurella fahalii]|uniref:Uncharacterized protein n=1 Tax=Madurella fahalii TaxID=1157608 RepID=A0ABQ0G7J6_9PEZI